MTVLLGQGLECEIWLGLKNVSGKGRGIGGGEQATRNPSQGGGEVVGCRKADESRFQVTPHPLYLTPADASSPMDLIYKS